MRRSFLRLTSIALLAAAFAAPQAGAQTQGPPLRSLEDAIESTTDAVLWPTSVPGTLTFRNCAPPCRVPSLEVNAQSAFYVGSTKLSLAELTAYLRTSGPQYLTVFRPPGRTNVTRVVVLGQVR